MHRMCSLVLGSRGAKLAQERHRALTWSHPMETRLQSVPQTILRLTAELYGLIARGEITRAEVIYARYRQGSAAVIERRCLFRVDFASLAADPVQLPPLHNLSPAALLTQAATESLASENAARFSAMESARDNVSKKPEQLRQEGPRARQDEITTEILDLVTGAQALQ